MSDQQHKEMGNSDLAHLADVKQLQIDSLLEVSQCINEDFSSHALLRVYEFILRAQMGVEKIAVFNENRDCIYCTGMNGKSKDVLFPDALSEIKKETHLEQNENGALKDYDWVIPVQHKNSRPLFAFICGLSSVEDKRTGEKIKFVRALSNMILSAIKRNGRAGLAS